MLHNQDECICPYCKSNNTELSIKENLPFSTKYEPERCYVSRCNACTRKFITRMDYTTTYDTEEYEAYVKSVRDYLKLIEK